MNLMLPEGNILSIPVGHLPTGNRNYPDDMDVQAIRRKRLQQLIDEYGNQTQLADKVGCEQNYISRAVRGKKRIKEDFAERLEQATEKPPGWLSRLEKQGTDWPFDFERKHWDVLPAEEKETLERTFMRLVLAAESEMAMKRLKKTRSS